MGNVIMSGIVPPLTAPSNLPAKGTALNDLTWEEIRAISDAGVASEYFNAGDTKTININGKVGDTKISNLSIDVFIIGIDHNSAKEGSNRIHFQIGKISNTAVALCDSKYAYSSTTSGYFTMNTSESNSGGWEDSYMRKTVLGGDSTPSSPTSNTLLAALPSDLRAVMKSVTKYSDNAGGGSDTDSYVTATKDYLWLLAEFEVFGEHSFANSSEQNRQAQYDYYKAGNSAIKYKYNAIASAIAWWLRSSRSGKTDYFCCMFEASESVAIANTSRGVAPCFAV